VLIFAQSCNNHSGSKESTAEVVLQPNDSIFHVNDGGYNFSIILPKDLMIASSPNITVNSATGELHIQVGDQFWIVASQEKMDMSTIRTAMTQDMLFTTRIVEESNSAILYQRILPDGTEYDYSYRNVCEVGGKPYTFKTCEEGEFSMDNVTRMKTAICSVRSDV
jgi:hypothetical protein